MSAPLHEIKQDIVRVCRNIDVRAYVGGRDGNVSARVSDTKVVITPAGVRKGDVTVEQLVAIDREGGHVSGRARASSETGMHLRIYDLRPDVRAVVHAHPPVATGFAATGLELAECVLPEVVVSLGRVPIARYATPGTPELSDSLDPIIADHDAYLLENHGVVTVGTDVKSAYERLETVEHAARILMVARLLGGPNALTAEQVGELVDARERYGIRRDLATCAVPSDDEALIEAVVARVLERLGQ